MDTRQMRYFVALAETLHFGHAAARMNMSQPPFSRQIAAIERELGVRLVSRNSRNVALTQAGERFLQDSRRVLAQFDTACRDARLVAEGQKGELRLGFMMHAAHRIVPHLVSLYTSLQPDVRLILEEAVPVEIDKMMLQGRLDAAVTFGERQFPQLKAVPILKDHLRLIVPSDHKLAARDLIVPQDLQGESLIAAPGTTVPTLRGAIVRYCESGGVIPHFRFEPQLQHTIIRLVAAGLGIGLVPGSICDETIPGIVSRPLSNAPTIDVVLYVAREATNPALPALIDLVQAGHLSRSAAL